MRQYMQNTSFRIWHLAKAQKMVFHLKNLDLIFIPYKSRKNLYQDVLEALFLPPTQSTYSYILISHCITLPTNVYRFKAKGILQDSKNTKLNKASHFYQLSIQ